MRIPSLGLFCLASIALMIAVPAKLSASGPGSSRVKLSVVDGKDIYFSHLSRQEGLSQSIVEHILQDDQGFIWFGTGDGLDRFDGYTFNQYKRGASGSKDLSGVVVTALLKDRSGVLWIGARSILRQARPGHGCALLATAPTQKIRAAWEGASTALLKMGQGYYGLAPAMV